MWIARGKSNRDIAEILSLSPRTVNKHLEQIYAKLGVENRASAAALAVRMLGSVTRTRRRKPPRFGIATRHRFGTAKVSAG